MATGNWRDQLVPGTRQLNFTKIKNKLMRHCFRDEDGLLELKKVAHSVEEKAYAGATSQSDYLEKIASAMQLIEKAHNWRVQLGPDYRQRSVNKILDTLRRHFPHNDPEELQVIWSVAQMFEEYIFNVATSQTDYLQKISLKMLTMETKSQEDHGQPSNQFGPDNQPAYPVNLNCMDTNNWRPNQGTEPNMGNSDWRGQLQPESRQRIVNKIMDTLKRHLPISGQEGLHQLRKIAQRFEEKIFTAATNQSDYLRKIYLKMLIIETKSQGTMANNIPSNQVGPSNTMTSMQHNSMTGVSTAQQNMMNSMQPGTNLDPGQGNAMSSLQQVPVSSLQQNSVSAPQQTNVPLPFTEWTPLKHCSKIRREDFYCSNKPV